MKKILFGKVNPVYVNFHIFGKVKALKVKQQPHKKVGYNVTNQ